MPGGSARKPMGPLPGVVYDLVLRYFPLLKPVCALACPKKSPVVNGCAVPKVGCGRGIVSRLTLESCGDAHVKSHRLVSFLLGAVVFVSLLALVVLSEAVDRWQRANCRYFHSPDYCAEIFRPRPGQRKEMRDER